MLLYILKSASCLLILLAFYKIFLERENMHTFKRFYLLGSLLAAFTIPFITFVEYIEIPVVSQFTEQSNSNVPIVSGDGLHQYPADYLPTILWSIYVLGFVVFGFKFLKNLSRITQRIRKNPKLRINRITNVLLRDSIIPHTFFNYIFLNKQKFEAKEIPAEVLLHEETHARQKHSFDVLFTEFVQLIFWFNPFIYVLKKAVKLNHEFLADREVVRKGIKPSIYQNILLEFSSNFVQPQLANAINYSSIKKRFTIMKTKTSKKSILIRSILVLTLLISLVYGFSQKKILEVYPENNQEILGSWIDEEDESTELSIYEQNGELVFDWGNSRPIRVQIINGEYYYFSPKSGLKASDRRFKLPIFFDKEKGKLTYSKMNYIPIGKSNKGKLYGNWENKKEGVKFVVGDSGNEIIWDVIKASGKPVRYYPKKMGDRYAFTYGKELELWSFKVENDILHDSKGIKYSRIPEVIGKKKVSERELKVIQINITKNGDIIVEGNSIAIEFLHLELKKFYPKLSKEERTKSVRSIIKVEKDAPTSVINKIDAIITDYGVAQIDIIGPLNYSKPRRQIIEQEGATKKQIEEYNALAKKYYELPHDAGISRKEIERINYIYGIMTERQRADSEPFPFPDFSKEQKFQEGATKKQIEEYNALASKYNKMSKDNFRVIGEDVRKLEYIYSMMSEKQRKKAEPFPNFPPPPPPPTAPKTVKGKASTISPLPPSAPKIEKRKAGNLPPPPPSQPNHTEVEAKEYVVQEIIENQEIYDELSSDKKVIKKIMEKEAFISEEEKRRQFFLQPKPPSPPKRISPLDHVQEMAKKNATFYFEGKEISSDKAITLLKKNKKINLRTIHEGLKEPIVELSTKPIIIKK